ncbi:hypothetical protein AB3N59_19725 [Leptospira sp. WS92.C1]
MKDYSILFKESVEVDSGVSVERVFEFEEWDFLISTFNHSERVKTTFNSIKAKEKIWLTAPEYRYPLEDLPFDSFISEEIQEDSYVNAFFEKYIHKFKNKKVCLDISGMMRQTILYIMYYMMKVKHSKFDIIYSEPNSYVKKEETEFSDGNVAEVRPIRGYEGSINSKADNDLLIIGAGYDFNLIEGVSYIV